MATQQQPEISLNKDGTILVKLRNQDIAFPSDLTKDEWDTFLKVLNLYCYRSVIA